MAPAFTRVPFSTAIDFTAPGSRGWITFERPVGCTRPVATA